VVAENTGTYKLWFDSNGGKMRIYRIVRAPYVKVTGKIDLAGNKIPAYTVHFLNKTTKQLTAATVKPTGEYSVNLAPGYQYIAMLKDVTGYGFTNETKSVNITTKDIATDKTAVNLKVEPKVMYTLSGSIKGFAKDYDVSKLEIKMNPPKEDSITQPQVVSINKKEMTYSVTLESNIDYTAQLTGANDYDISSGASCKNKLNVKQDIAVATKPVYNVSGNFIGLSSATSVKEVVFKNMSDGYTYKGAVSGTGFTAKLRQGDYEVSLVNDTLKTLGHISINKADVKKDIMVSLIKPVQQTYAWVSDIYVGYADKKNNFKTLSEAVEAAATMNIQSEQQRVTVHIAPGVYRQQLIVDTPYLTFVNDEPSKGEVKLTWYYGIGYKYYSVRNVDSTSGVKGYYDKELAFDKYLKAPVEKWGTAVYLTSKANGFTAKDIVFENSFNRYVTKEEIADGVEVAGTSDIKLERKIDSAVNTRAYKERAAAMYIDADRVEFENCSFLSNQDTLGTGASGTHKYFKNCLIEGGTDYICGGGDCVFDNCQLNWFGASDQALTGQVITAAKADTNGYLFRNCTVTTTSSTNSNNMRSTGLFGRPWDQAAKVAFLNTKFENENSIDPAGWTSMSSATPAKASFFEANSTYNASVLDTTSREATLISSTAKAEDYNVKNFFGDWTPNYYVQESETSPVFEVAPTITSTNENKVLTVDYRFEAENDNLNDASLIQWYRVDSDGVETFIECNVAYISTSYTIKPEDKGFYIKAVVTPEVVSGLKAEAVAIQTGEKVK
jgi:pectin methylesterase-like acyl-CoA thioesterase